MMGFGPSPPRSPPRCGTTTPAPSASRRPPCGDSSLRTADCRSPTSSPTRLSPQALAAVGGWLDRVFSPLVTLWVFLGQVLSPDHSCRAAVARLNAHRVARGHKACSARTVAYCQARHRMPEAFLAAAACAAGRSLDAKAVPGCRWKGRRVYLFDGTTVTMPDTPASQAAYPQMHIQKPGLGSPARGNSRTAPPACRTLPTRSTQSRSGGGLRSAGAGSSARPVTTRSRG